jgi:uncharacterized repeat protein (TIGR01451 family)
MPTVSFDCILKILNLILNPFFMTKLTLLFLLLVLKFAPAKAQWVTIPDPNFVTKLTQLFPSCMNGNQMDTTCAGIVNATTLNVSSQNISDLTGIQYFNILTNLNCRNNQLTNISVLPITLQQLNCNSNLLSILPQLPNSLLGLSCDSNSITNLPILPNALFSLTCSNNQLSLLPILPNSITALNCSNNQISMLPPIPFVMSLFLINNNNFTCLNFLPQLVNMAPTFNGNISGNQLTCIPNFASYAFSLGLPICEENDPINNPNNCVNIENISGIIYSDQNSNCQFENGDLGNNNILVKLYDNQNNLIAQKYSTEGQYDFIVNSSGNFKLKIDLVNLPINMDCSQTDSLIVNLTSPTYELLNNNFSIKCDNVYDTWIQSVNSQGLVFPGQEHILRTNIFDAETWFNLICDETTNSGTVKVEIIGPITYVAPASGSLTPQVSNNVFVYNINDFSTLTPNSFGLQLMTDTTAQANDQICVHVEISPNPMDADTTNNVYDFCYNVVNSYDPNMKEVYPINVLPGYDDWFTYTIHFQNTGNAPAFNIRLRDTLDTQLDLNTFEVLGYSHPANVTVSGNILTVRFNNIMLPDSTSDYEGSMGYFQYRIKPFPNLPLGSQINNTAYIYFDFNTPIITNTTENNFEESQNVSRLTSSENSFSLYPNPSTGIFTFKDAKAIQRVEVYNVMGQEIAVFAGDNTNKVSKQINLSNYSKGIYFAKINGSVVIKLVKE